MCALQGAITGSTLASTAATGANEVKYFNYTLNVSSLIPGVNVFACELHQDSRTASDAYFDAELLARSLTNFVQPTPSRTPSRTPPVGSKARSSKEPSASERSSSKEPSASERSASKDRSASGR
jgi:hypothetical protein